MQRDLHCALSCHRATLISHVPSSEPDSYRATLVAALLPPPLTTDQLQRFASLLCGRALFVEGVSTGGMAYNAYASIGPPALPGQAQNQQQSLYGPNQGHWLREAGATGELCATYT